MPPKITPDQITVDAKDVLKKPCNVVAMTGYLAVDDNGNYRLYQDSDFRQWIEIGPYTIEAQYASEDEHKKGQSTVWLDCKQTIVVCEQVMVQSYAPQPRWAVRPGEEDLPYEHPRGR